jgi:hypothetical protein
MLLSGLAVAETESVDGTETGSGPLSDLLDSNSIGGKEGIVPVDQDEMEGVQDIETENPAAPLLNGASPDVNEQFSVVCVINNTGITVNYSTKWGWSSNWTGWSLADRWYRWYSWPSTYSPRFYIQFDYDLRPNRYSLKTYWLPAYAAQYEACDYGAKYRFKREGDFIDLYRLN